MLIGCGGSVMHSSGTYERSINHNGIEIVDNSVKTSTEFKKAIIDCLNNSPEAVKYVRKISIVPVFFNKKGQEIRGDYDSHSMKIRITVYDSKYIDEIDSVVYHELGHAIWFNRLTKEQRNVWDGLYSVKLMGREFSWRRGDIVGHHGMPSIYSTTNVKEFFAEHYKIYKTDQNLHEIRFWQANDLMLKQGVISK